MVDDIADVFIGRVASYRGVSAEHVLEHFGQGGILVGRNAVRAGLADDLGSLESIIAGLAGKSLGGKTMKKIDAAPAAQPAILDRETLAAEHPELFAAIVEEGRAVAFGLGETKGRVEGPRGRRSRSGPASRRSRPFRSPDTRASSSA